MKMPSLFCWDGGPLPDSWSFGWWTGPDGDLHCAKPNIYSAEEAEIYLSPIEPNRLLALISSLGVYIRASACRLRGYHTVDIWQDGGRKLNICTICNFAKEE